MKKNVKVAMLFTVIIALGIAVFNACQESTFETPESESMEVFHELGCLFLPEAEYAKIPEAKAPEGAVKASVSISTPSIRNQGGEGSCVAWGTTYAARSIERRRATGASSYSTSTNIFSPEYVYNQIKISSSCASGSYVTTGLNLLRSQGACRWYYMPYTDGTCSTYPNSTQRSDAAKYKISSYSTVSRTTSNFKSFLNSGKPIIVAGPVNSTYMNLGYNQVLGAWSGSSYGGHCYCIVGYDDTKGAFKFMNSWGTSWGTSGYGWISYNYLTTWIQEAYVIY